jgi:cation transport ATPase
VANNTAKNATDCASGGCRIDSNKQRVVFVGVQMSACAFAALALRCAYAGGFGFILAFLSLTVAILIFRGVKIGLVIARIVVAIVAIFLLGLFTPFAYEDIVRAKMPYHYLLSIVFVEAVLIFFFFSLGARVKLMERNKSGARRE